MTKYGSYYICIYIYLSTYIGSSPSRELDYQNKLIQLFKMLFNTLITINNVEKKSEKLLMILIFICILRITKIIETYRIINSLSFDHHNHYQNTPDNIYHIVVNIILKIVMLTKHHYDYCN